MKIMHSGHYIVRCNGSLRELTEELPEYRNALDRELLAKHPLLQNESILSNDQNTSNERTVHFYGKKVHNYSLLR